MKSVSANTDISAFILILTILVALLTGGAIAQQAKAVPDPPKATLGAELFSSPEKAAEALLTAAETFDVPTLMRIFGPEGKDIVLTGEFSLDRKHAMDFAAEGKEKKKVSLDPHNANRAFILVGIE